MIGRLWELARQTEDPFALQDKVHESLTRLTDRVQDLETRMARLEHREAGVLAEARGVAAATASTVASGILVDAITRITRLEDRLDRAQTRGGDGT